MPQDYHHNQPADDWARQVKTWENEPGSPDAPAPPAGGWERLEAELPAPRRRGLGWWWLPTVLGLLVATAIWWWAAEHNDPAAAAEQTPVVTTAPTAIGSAHSMDHGPAAPDSPVAESATSILEKRATCPAEQSLATTASVSNAPTTPGPALAPTPTPSTEEATADQGRGHLREPAGPPPAADPVAPTQDAMIANQANVIDTPATPLAASAGETPVTAIAPAESASLGTVGRLSGQLLFLPEIPAALPLRLSPMTDGLSSGQWFANAYLAPSRRSYTWTRDARRQSAASWSPALGLQLGRTLNQHWWLEAGWQYQRTELKQRSLFLRTFDASAEVPDNDVSLSMYALSAPYPSGDAEVTVEVERPNQQLLSQGEAVRIIMRSQQQQRIHGFSLGAGYQLFPGRRLQLGLLAGLSVNHLATEQAVSEVTLLHPRLRLRHWQPVRSAERSAAWSLDALVGARASLPLSGAFQLYAQPTWRTDHLTMNDGARQFSLRMGLQWRW
ncbi:MAG: hypothetical protein KDC54_24495 [Lewinella sp.]|nr:hypothetical protein [Lewinella sp.]